MKRTMLIFVVLIVASPARGQVSATDSVFVLPWRVAVNGALYASFITATHLQNSNSWWKGELGRFHIADDTAKTLGADKFGHFYFTYLAADVVGHSLVWSGVEQSKAFLFSGLGALAFQFYVEIEDGFHPELGFSVGDFLADIAGGAYPWLQHQYPILQNVRPKWSIIRSPAFEERGYRTIIDDYESHYDWVSVNVKELLPNLLPDFWPSFLAVAVGYGVKDLYRPGGGDRELYLALDYDFSKLPGDGAFLSALKHALNYYHLPAPTMRLAPGVITWGLRY
jgi:hypothetical protein